MDVFTAVPDLIEKEYCAVETLAMGVVTIKIMTQELAINFQCDHLEFEPKCVVQRRRRYFARSTTHPHHLPQRYLVQMLSQLGQN